MRRHLCIVALALAAGCGSDPEARQAEQVAAIEKFAEIDVPKGASEVRYEVQRGIDELTELRFTHDSASVRRAIREGGLELRGGLGDEPINWELYDVPADHIVATAHEDRGELVRHVLVRRSAPGELTAYVVAFTL